jgi:predicted Fe-Mo cluster-binding NifX family protein
MAACDAGALGPFLSGGSPGAKAFAEAASAIVGRIETRTNQEDETDMKTGRRPTDGHSSASPTDQRAGQRQRIAVPVTGGKLSAHFGHCEEFVILSPKEMPGGAMGEVEIVDALEAPPHQPGLLPAWLSERGVDVVIAGGMGSRAQELFCQAGIEVVVGAPSSSPKEIAQSYLDGTLKMGQNVCDH